MTSIESYVKRITEHQIKLAEYLKNPFKFDNKWLLKNAPNTEVINKIINARKIHLETEINTFTKNIQKILDWFFK